MHICGNEGRNAFNREEAHHSVFMHSLRTYIHNTWGDKNWYS